jgi:hypothetical protein
LQLLFYRTLKIHLFIVELTLIDRQKMKISQTKEKLHKSFPDFPDLEVVFSTNGSFAVARKAKRNCFVVNPLITNILTVDEISAVLCHEVARLPLPNEPYRFNRAARKADFALQSRLKIYGGTLKKLASFLIPPFPFLRSLIVWLLKMQGKAFAKLASFYTSLFLGFYMQKFH